MDPKNKPAEDWDDEVNRDRKLRDELGETTDDDDLVFNEEAGSYELDVKSDDPDYVHPDPYDSTAPNGEDDNSDWDEANLYVGDEYDKKASLERDVDKLGMHIADEKNLDVKQIDKELAKTPEDDRDDLDEEGYPKNDSDIAGGNTDEFLK